MSNRQTDRQTQTETDRLTDKQTHRDRKTERGGGGGERESCTDTKMEEMGLEK